MRVAPLKARRPWALRMKVSAATTLPRFKGGQFAAHGQTLPGTPYDGHMSAMMISGVEAQIGASLQRFVADRRYHRHNTPPRDFIAGRKNRVARPIRHEVRCGHTIEPVPPEGTSTERAVTTLPMPANLRHPPAWLVLRLVALLGTLAHAQAPHRHAAPGIKQSLHARQIAEEPSKGSATRASKPSEQWRAFGLSGEEWAMAPRLHGGTNTAHVIRAELQRSSALPADRQTRRR